MYTFHSSAPDTFKVIIIQLYRNKKTQKIKQKLQVYYRKDTITVSAILRWEERRGGLVDEHIRSVKLKAISGVKEERGERINLRKLGLKAVAGQEELMIVNSSSKVC